METLRRDAAKQLINITGQPYKVMKTIHAQTKATMLPMLSEIPLMVLNHFWEVEVGLGEEVGVIQCA